MKKELMEQLAALQEEYLWKLLEKGLGADPTDLYWQGLYGAYAEARGDEWKAKADELVDAGVPLYLGAAA